MAIQLQKGQKVSLSKERPGLNRIVAGVGWDVADPAGVDFDIDLTAFLTAGSGRVEDDRNIIFYNNAANVNESVLYSGDNRTGAGEGDDETVVIELALVPPDIAKIVFALTIHEADSRGQNFGMIANAYIRLLDAASGESLLNYDLGRDFSQETAIIVGELYRYNDEWRFSAVGSGFFGGLEALCRHFGLDIEGDGGTEATASLPVAGVAPGAGTAAIAAGVSAADTHGGGAEPIHLAKPPLPPRISLLKEKVDTVLAAKQAGNLFARVGLVLDISGSMHSLYKKGEVQKVVERILAVASRLDDDGIMDAWIFSKEFYRLPPATVYNYEGYVTTRILDKKLRYKIFGTNNEEPVMLDVLKKYLQEDPSPLPAFVVFVSDGGINSANSKKMQDILIQSSGQRVFWQFVGIGRSNFGVLQKLDDLSGRVLDNADFFPIDNIEKMSDEEIYRNLLNEFPGWCLAARSAGIIS